MQYINLSLYSEFFIICIVLALTPGVAILLTIKNTLFFGWKNTIYSVLGNTCVVTIYTIIATISTIYTLKLDSSKLIIVQYLGAGYLTYIGVNLWAKKISFAKLTTQTPNKLSLFKEAFFVALSNPKMIVFYIVMWSSFIDSTKPIILQGALMTITLVVWSIISLLSTMVIVNISRNKYITPSRLMTVNKVMSIAFVAIAISIAVKA